MDLMDGGTITLGIVGVVAIVAIVSIVFGRPLLFRGNVAGFELRTDARDDACVEQDTEIAPANDCRATR